MLVFKALLLAEVSVESWGNVSWPSRREIDAALRKQFLIGRADTAAGLGRLVQRWVGEVSIPVATVSSATCSAAGSDLPRFSARRSIPAHAFELKKNRCGIEPCSRTCDNEHTAASLGQSEILGIQDAPGDCSEGSSNHTRVRPSAPVRKVGGIVASEGREEAAEGVVPDGEDAGDVLPDDDGLGSSMSASKIVNCIGQPYEFEGEVAAVIRKGIAKASHAERLAGSATYQHIGVNNPRLFAQHSEVAMQRNVGIMMSQNGARERLNLGEGKRLPAQ